MRTMIRMQVQVNSHSQIFDPLLVTRSRKNKLDKGGIDALIKTLNVQSQVISKVQHPETLIVTNKLEGNNNKNNIILR